MKKVILMLMLLFMTGTAHATGIIIDTYEAGLNGYVQLGYLNDTVDTFSVLYFQCIAYDADGAEIGRVKERYGSELYEPGFQMVIELCIPIGYKELTQVECECVQKVNQR